jgi:hypothetical protein
VTVDLGQGRAERAGVAEEDGFHPGEDFRWLLAQDRGGYGTARGVHLDLVPDLVGERTVGQCGAADLDVAEVNEKLQLQQQDSDDVVQVLPGPSVRRGKQKVRGLKDVGTADVGKRGV